MLLPDTVGILDVLRQISTMVIEFVHVLSKQITITIVVNLKSSSMYEYRIKKIRIGLIIKNCGLQISNLITRYLLVIIICMIYL